MRKPEFNTLRPRSALDWVFAICFVPMALLIIVLAYAVTAVDALARSTWWLCCVIFGTYK